VRTIDLRRDTITLPSGQMREDAFRAPLGDSVYGEDPTHEALERRAAELLGKEEAIFVPSGTMGNLVALLSWTERGDEVILEENAHIRLSETGGAACVGGLQLRGVPGPAGVPEPRAIEGAIRADDIHYPRTSLVCLETTHYRYGGIAAPLETMAAVKSMAESRGLPVHLDGARLFNAAVALGVEGRDIARSADSVMISLSKGLGAPVGSMLCGSTQFMKKARRFRKMLGGGMRQTGWLAACGLVALSQQNIARLADDHANARLLAEGLSRLDGFSVDLERTQTNFVVARFEHPSLDARTLAARLKPGGVLVTPSDERTLRLVTSHRVTVDDIRAALDILGDLLANA